MEDRKSHLGPFVVNLFHTEDSIHGLPDFSVMPLRAALGDFCSPNPTSLHGLGRVLDSDGNWSPKAKHWVKSEGK